MTSTPPTESLDSTDRSFNTSYRRTPGYPQKTISPEFICALFSSFVVAIALVVIGALAISGHLNPVAAGGSIVGLAAVTGIVNVIGTARGIDKLEKQTGVYGIINAVAMIVMGSLTIAGIVSPAILGYVIVPIAGLTYCCNGTFFTTALLSY